MFETTKFITISLIYYGKYQKLKTINYIFETRKKYSRIYILYKFSILMDNKNKFNDFMLETIKYYNYNI